MLWFVVAIMLAHSGADRSANDGWSNLRHITRDRLYAVMLRDGTCEFGTLGSVGDQYVILGRDSALGLAIKRSQIVRISDNLDSPSSAAVFSARSSWADVANTVPKASEYFEIVTRAGEVVKSKLADAVPKSEVRELYFVRAKPLNIDEEYFGPQDDLKWLTSIPVLGPRLPTKISVLLYNSVQPEDNSVLKCRAQGL